MSGNLPTRPQTSQPRVRRRFWIPTFFEASVGIGLGVVWMVGIVIVIRHEQVGWLMAAVYLLMALVGAIVSWLLLWPLLRYLLWQIEEEK